MAKIKNRRDNSCWRGCRLRGTLPLLVGVKTCTAPLEKPRKFGINVPQDPATPLVGKYPKDAPSYHMVTYSLIFIMASFIKARTWNQPRCPSRQRVVKENVVHLHSEVLSAVKNTDMKFAGN